MSVSPFICTPHNGKFQCQSTYQMIEWHMTSSDTAPALNDLFHRPIRSLDFHLHVPSHFVLSSVATLSAVPPPLLIYPSVDHFPLIVVIIFPTFRFLPHDLPTLLTLPNIVVLSETDPDFSLLPLFNVVSLRIWHKGVDKAVWMRGHGVGSTDTKYWE
ncbi:hypothetical protein BDZ45DRAFT_755021 [Acephala macrosclerotiorum]|nr:hypothetical protein BDZ45DRAFT_755021 [Acephala macrosclerotiorum]